jgi:hypothetical protein
MYSNRKLGRRFLATVRNPAKLTIFMASGIPVQ